MSFLNVDLDIYSSRSLQPLVSVFDRSVHVLHVGRERSRYSAHIELASSGNGQSADRIIRGLIRLIEDLPRGARKLWDGASSRHFNIGIEAEENALTFELRLKPNTIAAIARVSAAVAVTVYADPKKSAPRIP